MHTHNLEKLFNNIIATFAGYIFFMAAGDMVGMQIYVPVNENNLKQQEVVDQCSGYCLSKRLQQMI